MQAERNRTGAGRQAMRLGAAALVVLVPLMAPMAQQRPDEPSADTGPRVAPPAAADPAATLDSRRQQTRAELKALSDQITLSQEKARALEASIAGLDSTNAELRDQIIQSAKRRKDLETEINNGEKRLSDLRQREATIRQSLHERRGLLAEVLAALQRMGRNPPPALLVTPEDALASVRSAILLGAVVPGMRQQTEALIADLGALTRLAGDILAERARMTTAMEARIEEERRMDLLISRNEAESGRSSEALASEREKAEALARRATNLEGLIASLESEISTLRSIANAAAEEEERRRAMTEEQRKRAEALAESGVPDKNRIAPAYAFSDLKKKLELPVAGDIVRRFGDDDGTGHTARGLTLAADPGTVVTAPADAHVVFAGAFRSYGKMVILNAGDGYHLVLAGMEEIKTGQGKFVFAGEPLAVMGEKRVASAAAFALETDRPTLYIEFRKDGKPVDSNPWWTATDTGKARNDS